MNNILTLNLPFILRKQCFFLRERLVLKIFWLLVFISIISFSISYIFQVNYLAQEEYLIKTQRKQLAQLRKENENLEVSFSKINSLAKMETSFQNQNFKKAKEVRYIQILETSVVTK